MDLLHKLKAKFKKPKEVATLEILEDKCVGCGKCAAMCKREVFSMNGRKAVVANREMCVGCGKCVEKMCNFGAINLVLANR